MYRKKYSTLSMFTSYPSHSCSVVSWQCKPSSNYIDAQSLICCDSNRSIAEMHWDTKLWVIPCESIANAMLAMHSISTFVLFVIHGPGPYSMNQLSKSCPNISWVDVNHFQFDSFNSPSGPLWSIDNDGRRKRFPIEGRRQQIECIQSVEQSAHRSQSDKNDHNNWGRDNDIPENRITPERSNASARSFGAIIEPPIQSSTNRCLGPNYAAGRNKFISIIPSIYIILIPNDPWSTQVLPYINGVNHIARIAAETDVEIGLVKACVQNLVYYKVVQVLPLLKYSNVYMCTRNLPNLTKDSNLAQACRKFVAFEPLPTPRPTLQKIMRIYSYMTHGVTLKSLCSRASPKDSNIDERCVSSLPDSATIQFNSDSSFSLSENWWPLAFSTNSSAASINTRFVRPEGRTAGRDSTVGSIT